MNSDKQILRLADITHSLYEKATIDTITGLFNRRHFIELARREYSRAKRMQSPISILLIEVESFKEINDQHGLHAGDQALRRLADYLVENTREIDICGRYGNDECAVLLIDADRSAALAVALRMLCYLDAQEHGNTNADCLFEINIGIAHSPCPAADSSIDLLLHQAEQALYIAKIDARNRVHLSRAD